MDAKERREMFYARTVRDHCRTRRLARDSALALALEIVRSSDDLDAAEERIEAARDPGALDGPIEPENKDKTCPTCLQPWKSTKNKTKP